MFFWAIGVPYWLPLALLVGITAQFIPIVGTYIGIAVPLLFVVFTNPLSAVWIILFATVYQQIETYLFTPRISNRTMDVNAGIALAAVFVGAAIWGPIGALIGIPLAAAVVAVVGTYGHRYELVPQLEAPELEDDEDDEDDEDHEDDSGVGGPGPGPGSTAVSTDERPADVADRRVAEPAVRSDDTAPVLSRPTSPS